MSTTVEHACQYDHPTRPGRPEPLLVEGFEPLTAGSCDLIAEIGSLPDLDAACAAAEAAHLAGFWGLKVQLFDSERLCIWDAPRYGTAPGRQRQDFDGQCLDRRELLALKERCDRLGLALFASCWDEDNVDLAMEVGMPLLKVGSGDITHELLLRYIGGCGVPVILSTGGSYGWEVDRALGWLARAPQIALAACTLAYPCQVADAHLNRIQGLSAAYPGLLVGYSDHCAEPWIAGQADNGGAAFVETHWTLTPGQGGDHDFALHPGNVDRIYDVPPTNGDIWGSSVIEPCAAELPARRNARRSITTRLPLSRGDRWRVHDLDFLRPGTGLQPSDWYLLLGRPAVRDYEPGEPLNPAEIIR